MTVNIKLHHVPREWVDLYDNEENDDVKRYLEMHLMFNELTSRGKFAMLATFIHKTADLEKIEVGEYLDALREAINDTFY